MNPKQEIMKELHKKNHKPNLHVYSRLPKGYHFIDPCRSLDQAKSMVRSYPHDVFTIIIRTGQSRGKNRVVFPYHTATRNPMY